MKTSDFDFILPKELIAQHPLSSRDECRLEVMNVDNQTIEHKLFYDIKDYLMSGDVLVLNDTKVLPARLFGIKEETNALIEILLLKRLTDNVWEVLAKPQKRLKIGTVLTFGDILTAKCLNKKEDGFCELEFTYEGIFEEILDKLGTMPIPPYITEKLGNKDDYQTVYATNLGSVAAPTAGLHFTKDLLQDLSDRGIKIAYLTLHVGIGTFRVVEVDDVKSHKMHSEFYTLDEENAEILRTARENGHKIISVGTTTTRTLETIYNLYNEYKPCSGWTDIFIYPGYSFKAIDGLITNFHLPKSTLIMLVSALAGKDFVLKAYQEAIVQKYRFYSFGDSMFILPKRN